MFHKRGGERVVERLLNLYPKADLFILFGNPESCLQTHQTHRIIRSPLAALPWIEKYYKLLLPLLPCAAESHDLRGYDLVISSSSCVAKGVICPPGAVHVSYIHSPMRYAWDMEGHYFQARTGWRWFLPVGFVRRMLLSRLRQWDVTSSARVDVLCANSHFVKRRIGLYYRREAQVIHPPVDTARFGALRAQRQTKQATVLLFGTWVPYKKMEWALAGLRAALPRNIQILAAGHGSGFESARRNMQGDPSVTFFQSPSASELDQLYAKSHVLAFPGVEDFGIVPVEAMAAGVWVVGPRTGGTGETILEGKTGFTFDANHDESLAMKGLLAGVLRALEQDSPKLDEATSSHLHRFSEAFFDEQIRVLCDNALALNRLESSPAVAYHSVQTSPHGAVQT
jgi:glycosyltransferase involved in cell wall biosynthesis